MEREGAFRTWSWLWVVSFELSFVLQQFVATVSYHVCYRVDQCDVKSSKKRPLFLVWTNPDPMAQCLSSDFQIIFKTGDGWYIALRMCSRKICVRNNTNLDFILSRWQHHIEWIWQAAWCWERRCQHPDRFRCFLCLQGD